MEKEAHRGPDWAILIGVKKEDRGKGSVWKWGVSHDWVRGGGTGLEGRWHSTGLERHLVKWNGWENQASDVWFRRSPFCCGDAIWPAGPQESGSNHHGEVASLVDRSHWLIITLMAKRTQVVEWPIFNNRCGSKPNTLIQQYTSSRYTWHNSVNQDINNFIAETKDFQR